MSANAASEGRGPSTQGSRPARGRLAKAVAKLRSVLTAGEKVQCGALQLRLWALLHRRAMVVATDRRILFFRRGLLGGFDLRDVQWQDVQDAHVKEHFFPHVLGADLAIETSAGASLRLKGLESDKARRIYAYAQSQEHAWREKNRIREIEEMRARSGGITLGGAGEPVASVAAGPVGGVDVTVKLKEAKELLDSGAISDAEYETIKARLINSL